LRKQIKLALKNPNLAWHKARLTLLSGLVARWQVLMTDGYARPPRVVAVRLTNLCNMNCKMCGQPKLGDRDVPSYFFKEHLSAEEWKGVVDQIVSFKPTLYLWGGEPLLFRGVFDLISYAKSRGLTVQINTNGFLLERFAQEIIDSELDDLIISIDGPEEIHDSIRGVPGAFQKVRKGVKEVLSRRAPGKRGKPVIRIRGTITPENYRYLGELVEITRDFGGDSLNFNHLWFTSRQRGRAYEDMMARRFGIDAKSWKGFVFEPGNLDLDSLIREFRTFRNISAEFPITISPQLKEEELGKYYCDLDFTCGAKTCLAIYFKTYLMPNGDVTTCPDFPDYVAGNVRGEELLQIWNGDKYRDFRNHMKKIKQLPVCSRCCDLFVSDVGFF
jgi:MoaA/NifB/PqqE/SkfB family radical SAM enzyme